MHLIFTLEDIIAFGFLGIMVLVIAACWIWLGFCKLRDWVKKVLKRPAKDEKGADNDV